MPPSPAMRPVLAALLACLAVHTAAAQPDGRRPPLFAVGDGGRVLHLLGSVHVLPDGALPLPPHVDAVYERADVVAFEIDLDAAQADLAAVIARATDEETVADALAAGQRDSLGASLARLGLPPGALDGYEPWFAGLTVGVLALQRSGLAARAGGVDAHLFTRAGADGKRRVALETAEDQLAAFDDLPLAVQVRSLMAAAAAPPDLLAGQFETLVEAWGSGDDDRLASLLEDESAGPEVAEAVLLRRNRAWVPQIVALLSGPEPALVVVGAAHLVGPGSVVDLLRRSGRTVTRL